MRYCVQSDLSTVSITLIQGLVTPLLKRMENGNPVLGQVRSEFLTCTFRASCCSARLSWAHAPGQETMGSACSDRYKGIRAVRLESVRGGGWFEVLWNLECAHFNEGNVAQFRRSAEK